MKNAEEQLTQEQIDTLFDYSANSREGKLRSDVFGEETWKELEPNERLTIESLNYNSRVVPSGKNKGQNTLVGKHTNFNKQTQEYVKDKKKSESAFKKGDFDKAEEHEKNAKEHLNEARFEVKNGSNKEKSGGIQDRRNAEEEMLNTYDEPLKTPEDEAEKARKEAEDKLSELEKELPTDEEIEGVAQEVADANKQDQKEKIEQTCGVEPTFEDQEKVDGMTTAFVADHKQNVQTIADDIRLKIQNTIDNAIYSAKTSNQILAEVDLILNGFLSRSGRMNDGIIMNFNAQLSKSRQTSFGVTRYIWRSSDDDKVRENHAHNDDQVRNWEEGEIPGEAYNCRCEAEPVCPDDEEMAA